jgi:hypothetical protein
MLSARLDGRMMPFYVRSRAADPDRIRVRSLTSESVNWLTRESLWGLEGCPSRPSPFSWPRPDGFARGSRIGKAAPLCVSALAVSCGTCRISNRYTEIEPRLRICLSSPVYGQGNRIWKNIHPSWPTGRTPHLLRGKARRPPITSRPDALRYAPRHPAMTDLLFLSALQDVKCNFPKRGRKGFARSRHEVTQLVL